MGVALLERPMSGVGADDETAADARIADAVLACVARFGLTKTTLDDVAREAGISRATLYRAVPGGRDVLLRAVLGREVRRFFDDVAVTLARLDDLEDVLTAALGAGLRELRGHPALRAVVAHDAHLLLPQLAFHRLDPLLRAVSAGAAPLLEPHVGPDEAGPLAEHLVRIALSHSLDPSDRVDPHDEASMRRFVATHVLPGIPGRTPPTEANPQPRPVRKHP